MEIYSINVTINAGSAPDDADEERADRLQEAIFDLFGRDIIITIDHSY